MEGLGFLSKPLQNSNLGFRFKLQGSTAYALWVVVKIKVPFWGTLNNSCRIMIGTQKGTIILRCGIMIGSQKGTIILTTSLLGFEGRSLFS